MILYSSNYETNALGVHILPHARDYANAVLIRKLVKGTDYVVVPDDKGPVLEFLECYTYSEKYGSVFHQLKFDEAIRKRWRVRRAEKLKALDLRYILALERNHPEEIAEVIRQKNLLREVTKCPIPPHNSLDGPVRNYVVEYMNYLPEILK